MLLAHKEGAGVLVERPYTPNARLVVIPSAPGDSCDEKNYRFCAFLLVPVFGPAIRRDGSD